VIAEVIAEARAEVIRGDQIGSEGRERSEVRIE
jgi:hypothetical protein